MNKYSSSPEETKSCLAIIFLIVLIVAIPFLISLIKTLIVVAVLGGIGYLVYQVLLYDKRTGNVTFFLEDKFNLPQSRSHQNLLPGGEFKTLDSPEDLSDFADVEEIKEEIEEIKKNNEVLRNSHNQIIKDTIETYGNQIDKRNKKEVLDQIFGNDTIDYAQSDEFELKEFQAKKRKQEEELEIRELKVDVNEQLFEQQKETYDIRMEAKGDNMQLRHDMEKGFNYLEKEIYTLKGFVTEKFAFLDARITKEISNVKELISNLRVELKTEISEFKVQMESELVNVHKNMQMVVGKLHEYETRMEKFTYEVRQIKVDAERRELRGQRILNQAQAVYNKHMSQIQVVSKDIDMTLKEISVHKGDFANRVASSKMMLQRAADEQHLALKEIGFERVGVTMLRQDFEQRTKNTELQMARQIDKKIHLQEKIKMNQENFQAVAGLRHQLYKVDENLQHTRNQARIMDQESKLFNRLSS